MRLNNKGFTLVEVLAIVVILGIIGGIAITSVLSSINKSKDASYKLMINNIVTASGTLYEEVEFNNDNDSKIFQYNINGIENDKKISIIDKTINTNLQTLVSNGFLNGTINCDEENNCKYENNNNKKVIINPKTDEDLGDCKIIIRKENGNYIVEPNDKTEQEKCPESYNEEDNND